MEHPINRKELLTLILADMRNRRLMLGLQQAGLNPDDFYTDLTDLILQKTGLDHHSEEVCTWYEETLETLIDKDLRYFNEHQRELAKRMLQLMISKKQILKPDGDLPFALTSWGRELWRKWKQQV